LFYYHIAINAGIFPFFLFAEYEGLSTKEAYRNKGLSHNLFCRYYYSLSRKNFCRNQNKKLYLHREKLWL